MRKKIKKLSFVLLGFVIVVGLLTATPLTVIVASDNYNTDDIAVINAIIDKNHLGWDKAPSNGSSIPASWTFAQIGGVSGGVIWSGDTTNKRIIELRLSRSGLTGALSLSGLSSLQEFWCYDNDLTSLDVSGLANLAWLDCESNALTSLNLSGLTNLEGLWCYNNALTSLNMSSLTKLERLDCSCNSLKTLDVNGLAMLERLDCSYNSLTSLDVSSLTNLERLDCSNNYLKTLQLNSSSPYVSINARYNIIDDESSIKGRLIPWGDTDFYFAPSRTDGSPDDLQTETPPDNSQAETLPDNTQPLTPPDDSEANIVTNFIEVNTYLPGQFIDVDENAWFGFNRQKVVAQAFEYSLMNGKSTTIFNPTGNATVAEAIAVMVRLHSIYTTGTADFAQGDPWYKVYVDYAIANGLISSDDFEDYTRVATRNEIALFFSRSLPVSEFRSRNTVNSLPDVNIGAPYNDSILTLYRAGVLAGCDEQGTFYPENPITRADTAAIIVRVIHPGKRLSGASFSD